MRKIGKLFSCKTMEDPMAKGIGQKKETKKKASTSLKEKRLKKQEKKQKKDS